MLRPLDIVVLLKMHSQNEPAQGQMKLAGILGISSRSVNGALKRGAAARLYDPIKKRINPNAMEEALVHGARYFLAAKRGTMTRGVPTAWAAPPLSELLAASKEPPPVWPDPEGTIRGIALEPLHSCVPNAALLDKQLYELLALVDALRSGTAREVSLAAAELRKRLKTP